MTIKNTQPLSLRVPTSQPTSLPVARVWIGRCQVPGRRRGSRAVAQPQALLPDASRTS